VREIELVREGLLQALLRVEDLEREEHRPRHHRELFVFFFSAEVHGEGVSIMNITQIVNNDPKGAFVQIAETDANGNAVASSGPFAIEVVDQTPPITTVTPGSPDNTTPTRIVGNGSGVGQVTVNVTDQSNGAKGSAVLQVVAPAPPPPPPVPTLTVSFAPGT
jgi:hypothetical protein